MVFFSFSPFSLTADFAAGRGLFRFLRGVAFRRSPLLPGHGASSTCVHAADKKTPTGAQPVGVISLASREAVSGEPHRPLVSPPIILSARRRSRFSSAPAPKA